MFTRTPSTDLDPALSPLEPTLIRAPRVLEPHMLPEDEQRLLEATLEALANGEGAPDAIVAGFKEELAELRTKRAA